MAQKEYDKYVLDEIGKREKDIRNYLALSENRGVCDAYDRLPCAKQRLVTPYVLSDESSLKPINTSWIDMLIGKLL